MTTEKTKKAQSNALLLIEGKVFDHWTSLEVGMDLANLAGVFRAELALSFPPKPGERPKMGASVEIHICNIPVLKGWIEAINSRGDEHSLSVTISGRDLAGDIVDCTAQPEGPGRMDNVRLETVVGSLANPYGLSVKRVVDTGAPFEVVAFEAGSSVHDAIEKQSRQRGVLVTSDGLGKILLTKPGNSRADEDLIFPNGNVRQFEERLSQNYSDHIVKAQGKSDHRGSQSPLSAGSAAGARSLTKGHTEHEKKAACAFGYCYDEKVGRYRPKVYVSGTTSKGQQQVSHTGEDLASILQQSQVTPRAGWHKKNPPAQQPTPPRKPDQPFSLDDQASWRMRTNRAHSTARVYNVPRLLTSKNTLWRPNQLVRVKDDISGVDGDMLIGAITWNISGSQCETRISVVPPDAYDLTGEEDHTPTKGQVKRKNGTALRRANTNKGRSS